MKGMTMIIHRNKVRLLLVMAAVFLMLGIVACSGQGNQEIQNSEISVGNDSAEQGTWENVTDPDAGKVSRPVQSEGVDMEAGITAPPATYDPEKDPFNSATGTVPAIIHGSANGEDCVTCHGSETAEFPLPQSHVEAGLTNEYCRNCHQDA
jgi:hypothetical protein